jgi:hypothetical protein
MSTNRGHGREEAVLVQQAANSAPKAGAEGILAVLTKTVTYVGDDCETNVVLIAGTIVTIDPRDQLICHQGHYFHAEPFEYRVLA